MKLDKIETDENLILIVSHYYLSFCSKIWDLNPSFFSLSVSVSHYNECL